MGVLKPYGRASWRMAKMKKRSSTLLALKRNMVSTTTSRSCDEHRLFRLPRAHVIVFGHGMRALLSLKTSLLSADCVAHAASAGQPKYCCEPSARFLRMISQMATQICSSVGRGRSCSCGCRKRHFFL